MHSFLRGSEGVSSEALPSTLSISTSQEYQQSRRHLQKRTHSKNANRFGGNCFSNDERFKTSNFFLFFSLPLYSFPVGHFSAILAQKHNLSYWPLPVDSQKQSMCNAESVSNTVVELQGTNLQVCFKGKVYALYTACGFLPSILNKEHALPLPYQCQMNFLI